MPKFKIFILLILSVLLLIWLNVLNEPLSGTHEHRQADTLFTAWSYCYENTNFFFPTVIFRENTPGVAIGEFPLWSWVVSIPCKLTGQWSEALPRVFSLFLFLSSGLLWWLWFVNSNMKSLHFFKYNLSRSEKWLWFVVYIFSTFHIMHYLIPLPDVFAMNVIALSALGFQRANRLIQYFSGGLFLVGFLIRPYFFPILFLIVPGLNVFVWTSGLMLIGYYCWFHQWTSVSNIDYYAVHLKPLKECLLEFPQALKSVVYSIFRSHLNFVLIWPFILFASKNKKIFFIWLSSLLVIVFLRGNHLIFHNYYLGAINFISLLMASYQMQFFSKNVQKYLLSAYAVIGLMNTQHLYHPNPKNWPRLFQDEAKAAGVAPQDKVGVYISFDPSFLYWSKHIGWLRNREDMEPGVCDPGAQWMVYLVDDKPHYEICKSHKNFHFKRTFFDLK